MKIKFDDKINSITSMKSESRRLSAVVIFMGDLDNWLDTRAHGSISETMVRAVKSEMRLTMKDAQGIR